MKKNFTRLSLACLIMITAMVNAVHAQTDTASATTYENLSLKDLLNIKIVSVSKSSESLFEAPLSASVITKEDILKAGCTSVMEAMRLVPGMIVREETNGNYDVQLRGVYTFPNAQFDANAVTSLVMIDNRPIFNYLKGSTLWETLPVDLNDIEKIEVVRGPAGALYGPNAVNGVINIITRKNTKDGWSFVANSRHGTHHTIINNASIGYQQGKFSFIASGNYQQRDRTQTSYFEFFRNQWFDHPPYFVNALNDTVSMVDAIYPRPGVAMEKYGGNIFLNYAPAEKVRYSLSAGMQHSFVQNVGAENGLGPLSSSLSDTRYADLHADIKGITAQVAYVDGTQTADFQQHNKYDFNTIDVSMEYNYAKGNFTLKPSLGYRDAVYDDTKYATPGKKDGMFNARGEITTKLASLRGEYKLLDNKLRLVAGVASNTFNYPDTTYLSYELAATYKLSRNHLVRVVYSKSPRSNSIFDTYINQDIISYPTATNRYTLLQMAGNKNQQLLTSGMFEIGYRGRILLGLSIDVELFNICSNNYSVRAFRRAQTQVQGADTIDIVPMIATTLPVKSQQPGATIAFTYSFRKWQVHPFITMQQTTIKNYAPYAAGPDAPPTYLYSDPVHHNIYSGMGTTTDLTIAPKVFGGASVQYDPSPKWSANLNAYYFSGQTIYHATYIIFNDGVRGMDHVPAKLILNANVMYEPAKGIKLFATAKNILNQTSREFYRTDAVPFQVQGGVSLEF